MSTPTLGGVRPQTALSPLGPRTLGPSPLEPRPLEPRPLGPIAGGGLVAPIPSRRREFAPNATLVERHDLTPSVARLVVRPDGGVPAFKPGQYFALGLEVDGALLQRPYSTASPAGTADQVEFLVRRVPTGSFTPRLWEAGTGARVWLGPPKGLFTLQPDDRRTHLLISTGTGLAPFMSMADALLRRDSGSREVAPAHPLVVVVHGASYADELAYRDRLEAWVATGRLAYVPTISRPGDPANAGWTGETGRTEAVLSRVCDAFEIDPEGAVAYVCGNPDMIEAAAGILVGRGFGESAVVREHYWTAASASAA